MGQGLRPGVFAADADPQPARQPVGGHVDPAGQRYLALADGPTISFLQMAQILRERLGPLAERVPTEEAAGPEPPRLIIHNDRAKQELGWRPAETTIVETAESLRDGGLLAGVPGR